VLVVILLLILAVVWIVNTRAEYKAQRAKFEELMGNITRVDNRQMIKLLLLRGPLGLT